MYYANTDLLISFHCDQQVSYRYTRFHHKVKHNQILAHTSLCRKFLFLFDLQWIRYKYKFLRATTSNIPSSVIRENRGSKLTIGRGGLLKVQHLVSVGKPSTSHTHIDSAGYQQPSRIAFIEFFVKPEEDSPND